MPPLLRRVFSRQIFTRVAFTVALGATFLFAFIAFENWQGNRAWAAYRADADRRGVPYQRTAFLPPAVPDVENFAAIPLFQEVFAASAAHQPIPDPLKWNPPVPQTEIPALPNRLKREQMDFAKWQRALIADHRLTEPTDNAARDTLTGLAGFEPALEQLRDAARRPRCRFPVHWAEGAAAPLPHLSIMLSAARLDAVRMMAHLALGDSPAALADWSDGLALYRALEHEPSLVCAFVRIANVRSMQDAMWQGLATRQWSEPELRAIMADLASLDLFADCRFALASERCNMNGITDDLMNMSIRERGRLIDLSEGPEERADFRDYLARKLYPLGWARESQVKINELFDRRLVQIDAAHGRMVVGPSSDEELMGMKRLGGLDRWRYILAALLMPALNTAQDAYAFAHTTTQQARTACALELFRRAHGTFPERLEELVPETLQAVPQDVMDGAPLRYRRTAEGGFELWSTGLDRHDDGGNSDPGKNSRDQPDWVWHS